VDGLVGEGEVLDPEEDVVAVLSRHVDPAVRGKDDGVGPLASPNTAVSFPSPPSYGVVAGIAVHEVVVLAAREAVVPVLAVERVIAGVALDLVVDGAAGEVVVAGVAEKRNGKGMFELVGRGGWRFCRWLRTPSPSSSVSSCP
jgi:hypothetical protein